MFSNSLVCFERFAPVSQTAQSVSSGLLLVLKVSSPFRVDFSLFSQSLVSSSSLLLVFILLSPFRAVCSLFSNSLVPF